MRSVTRMTVGWSGISEVLDQLMGRSGQGPENNMRNGGFRD